MAMWGPPPRRLRRSRTERPLARTTPRASADARGPRGRATPRLSRRRNDKGCRVAPLNSVGLDACHRSPGPARLLPRVSNAPFRDHLNGKGASRDVNPILVGSAPVRMPHRDEFRRTARIRFSQPSSLQQQVLTPVARIRPASYKGAQGRAPCTNPLMHSTPSTVQMGLAEDPEFFALLTRSYARLVGRGLAAEGS